MITKSKQAWEVGQAVNVGFLKGLTVAAKIATPGDCAPDAYVLVRGEQFYTFVPHNGLSKISAAEARKAMANAEAAKAATVLSQANDLKKRIAAMGAELKAGFNAHNAAILNGVCKELFELTGEVFSSGAFVKVA